MLSLWLSHHELLMVYTMLKELITQGKIPVKVLYFFAMPLVQVKEQQPTVSWKKLRSQSGGTFVPPYS